MKDLLATVSSLMLSNTSSTSASSSNESRRFSNVLVRIVSGLLPVNVCGSRVTRDIRGYGTYPPPDSSVRKTSHKRRWEQNTHPHLVQLVVLIPKDQVVGGEMEGADV